MTGVQTCALPIYTLRQIHHVLLAHGRAVQAIRAEARTKVEVGWTHACAPSVPATDAPADVEAAYTTLVECLTDAGLSGSLRFDLSISTALIQNIALGRTEAEARDAQGRLERCLEPFDTTVSAYMISHPPSDAERRTIRDGIRACADHYFPGKVGSELGYDETVTAYEVLLATSSSQDPRECADEANSKKWIFHAGLLRAQCLAMLGRFAGDDSISQTVALSFLSKIGRAHV